MRCPQCSVESFHKGVLRAVNSFRNCLLNNTVRHCAYKGDYFYEQVKLKPLPSLLHPYVPLHVTGYHALKDMSSFWLVFQKTLFFRASLYSVYIKDWLQIFPRSQLMVLKAENYYADRRSILEEVFKFLELGKLM